MITGKIKEFVKIYNLLSNRSLINKFGFTSKTNYWLSRLKKKLTDVVSSIDDADDADDILEDTDTIEFRKFRFEEFNNNSNNSITMELLEVLVPIIDEKSFDFLELSDVKSSDSYISDIKDMVNSEEIQTILMPAVAVAKLHICRKSMQNNGAKTISLPKFNIEDFNNTNMGINFFDIIYPIMDHDE